MASMEDSRVQITNWTLLARILEHLPQNAETEAERTAREAMAVRLRAAIATLIQSITVAYREAANNAMNNKESNKVIEWYKTKAGIVATDYAAYAAATDNYNDTGEMFTAQMTFLAFRTDDERYRFWQRTSWTVTVIASFFGHSAKVIDVQ